MPIYEYHCSRVECNHQFDEYLSMSNRDKPTTKPCPECGETGTVEKGVSVATMGADMNMTPDKATGGDWSKLMTKIKKATPARDHDRLDSYSSNSAGRLGPK